MPFKVNDLIGPERQRQILLSTASPRVKVPMRGADPLASVAHDPVNPVATGAEIETTRHQHLSFAAQGHSWGREAMRHVG
jgi:hypothetical protein